MKNISTKALRLFMLMAISAAMLKAQDYSQEFKFVQESGGIKEYTMTKNDLSILLMEDHSAPVLTFMVTYRVGSRNEAIGNTGSTHLLEHLMFKGTPTYNKAKGTTIFSVLQNVGAVINASTWNDRTNYFEMMPREHLELALQIEADRMRNLLLDEKDKNSEMTVVRNEFERGENDPEEALDKNIWATAYQAHPYHHSTIGWRTDIENVPINRLREFYETFYWPNNATVTIIGDFDTKNAMNLIYKYFGSIPKSPKPIPAMYTEEPIQEGPRRVIVKRTGETGIVGVAHKSLKSLDQRQYAFVVLDRILSSGKNSRFYRSLVDKGLAAAVEVQNTPFKDAGLFITYATLTPNTKHADVEKIILDEYKKIQDSSVTQKELDDAKAQIRVAQAFGRDGSFSVASRLNEAIAVGDWKYYTNFMDEINKVTAADIQAVAKKYLVEDQMTVGYFIPKSAGEKSTGSVEFKNEGNHPRSFRGSEERVNDEIVNEDGTMSDGLLMAVDGEQTKLAKNIVDSKINGIRVLSMKTSVKDVVTIRGSLMAGTYFSGANKAVADLTVAMLDQGTAKRDKFTISAELEKLGAVLNFTTGNETVNFSARCLRSDVGTVINILSEELRMPLFDEKALANVKKRRLAMYKQNSESTNNRATETLYEKIFPTDHPNYAVPTQQMIADIEKITINDLKEFHKKNYGPASMILVAVGDVDSKELNAQVQANFSGWSGGSHFAKPKKAETKAADKNPIIVSMKDKTSVSLVIGTGIGMQRDEKDFLPLFVGSYILGGNFSARLMSTVRDNEGLTYGINSFFDGHQYSDGSWLVLATFSPDLLKRGLESTRKQIALWLEKGVSEDELKAKKTTITGSYKVGLSTTNGIANQILSIAQRDLSLDFLDQYPDKISALTLSDVNGAIQKYIKADNLFTVAAGSIDSTLEKIKQ
jgi:zinc protease